MDKCEELSSILDLLRSEKRLGVIDIEGVSCIGNATNYASNFGLQWNKFQLTQFDSQTGLSLTEKRLTESSGWDLQNLEGKLVLELGSGAGRFTEVLKKYGALVVTIDLSDAIFANKRNNDDKNILFLKGSIEDLYLLKNIFDFVLCYGVAQHTPDPKRIYKLSCSYARQGGLISIDHYIKVWYPCSFYHPKYFWRHITRQMDPQKLLRILSFYLPFYIKFDTFLIWILPRKVSIVLRGLIPIPCWNYYGIPNIPQDKESLLEWAIMDTFDALGARYDYPASIAEVSKWVKDIDLADYEVKKGGNGIVFNGIA